MKIEIIFIDGNYVITNNQMVILIKELDSSKGLPDETIKQIERLLLF